VVETPDANLSLGMRQLNGVYTQQVNQTHGRVSHLFQGRFKGILVERDSYLLELARYAVLNPMWASLVAPEGWPWSGYRAAVGEAPVPTFLETDWLLQAFADSRPEAIADYRQVVANGIGAPLDDDASGYPDRDRALVAAYRSGAYSMQTIAEHFGVSRMTVSRAVKSLEQDPSAEDARRAM
jgi:putative transposase